MKDVVFQELRELSENELGQFNGGEDRSLIEWVAYAGGWVHREVEEFINLLGRTDWSESNYLNSGR